MSMTYEEMLAAETKLAHFNDKHDKLGRFARKLGGSVSSASNSMSPRGKQIAKRAALAGVAAGSLSTVASLGNLGAAQNALDAMGYGDAISKGGAAKAIAIKTGQVAAATALAVIGGHMVKDYMNTTGKAEYEKQKKELGRDKKKTDAK